jgi:hypothetical protein
LAVSLLAVGGLAGCGDGRPPLVVPSETREAAAQFCAPIRSWVNELAGLANLTTAEAGELVDPRARADRMLRGYGELQQATDRYRATVADLSIHGTTDDARATDDLRLGAERAAEVLSDERREFGTATPRGVTDSDLVGRMGEFMISLETTYSAAEPPVVSYDDAAFKQAVLDEPSCDQVVQPFELNP